MAVFDLRYPLQRARLWWSTLMPLPKDSLNRQPFDNAWGVQQIFELFHVLSTAGRDQNSPIEHQNAAHALYKSLGFKLDIGPSSLPGAGNGVYLKGMCEQGDIVSLYPGTRDLIALAMDDCTSKF
jgi:hypothetical protein